MRGESVTRGGCVWGKGYLWSEDQCKHGRLSGRGEPFGLGRPGTEPSHFPVGQTGDTVPAAVASDPGAAGHGSERGTCWEVETPARSLLALLQNTAQHTP